MEKLDLADVIEKLRTVQPELRSKHGVSGLWVFGSYVRGEERSDSDLDILIEFDRPGMTLFKFAGIENELSDYLNRKVDLVQRTAIKPRMRSAILAEAVAV